VTDPTDPPDDPDVQAVLDRIRADAQLATELVDEARHRFLHDPLFSLRVKKATLVLDRHHRDAYPDEDAIRILLLGAWRMGAAMALLLGERNDDPTTGGTP